MVLSNKMSFGYDLQAAVIPPHIKPVKCRYKVTCIYILLADFNPGYGCILDLFDGAEAVGGGGGPVRYNSSM